MSYMTEMRAALDTNLLVYAEAFCNEARVGATRQLLDQLSEADLVIPLQCLGELLRVLTGWAGRPRCRSRRVVSAFCSLKSCTRHLVGEPLTADIRASIEGIVGIVQRDSCNDGNLVLRSATSLATRLFSAKVGIIYLVPSPKHVGLLSLGHRQQDLVVQQSSSVVFHTQGAAELQ